MCLSGIIQFCCLAVDGYREYLNEAYKGMKRRLAFIYESRIFSSLRWFAIIVIKTIFWDSDTGKEQTIIDLADWSCPKNIAKSFAPDEQTLIGNLLQLNDYIS